MIGQSTVALHSTLVSMEYGDWSEIRTLTVYEVQKETVALYTRLRRPRKIFNLDNVTRQIFNLDNVDKTKKQGVRQQLYNIDKD